MTKKNVEASSPRAFAKFQLATVVALVTLWSWPAHAITFIEDRESLQGNDEIVFSNFEQIFDPSAPNPEDFLSDSFSTTSFNGLGVTIEIPSAGGDTTPPFVFQNSPGVQTNFAPNDFLLFTGFSPTIIPTGNPNPLTIIFNESVMAAGTQIAASGSENNDYTVSISAFDDENNLLGEFSAPGISSGERDNSAIFLGVSSDAENIKSMIFSTTSPQRGFGINTVSIVSQAAAVPEPPAILCIGGASLLGIFLKRKI